MPRSCCNSDVNAASTSDESGGGAVRACSTSHGSVLGAQQHQKPRPGYAVPPVHDHRKPGGIVLERHERGIHALLGLVPGGRDGMVRDSGDAGSEEMAAVAVVAAVVAEGTSVTGSRAAVMRRRADGRDV